MHSNIVSLNKRFGRHCFKLQTEIKRENVIAKPLDRTKMTIDKTYSAPIFKRKPFVQIDTLSPNRKYYYKFQDPDDMYWGLFCCKLAFFNIDGELIYYNADQYAQCGIGNNEWDFVFYSQSGDIAFFVERNSTKTLAHVLIDLANKKIFRKEYTNESESKIITDTFAKNGFVDNEAIKFAENNFQNINSDKIEFELKSIIGLTSWRPN